jgi:hypothetical protein
MAKKDLAYQPSASCYSGATRPSVEADAVNDSENTNQIVEAVYERLKAYLTRRQVAEYIHDILERRPAFSTANNLAAAGDSASEDAGDTARVIRRRPKEYLTRRQAAEYIRDILGHPFSFSTANKLAALGEFAQPALWWGRRPLYTPDALRQWVEARSRPTKACSLSRGVAVAAPSTAAVSEEHDRRGHGHLEGRGRRREPTAQIVFSKAHYARLTGRATKGSRL